MSGLIKSFIKKNSFLLDSEAKKALPFWVLAFTCSSILDLIGVGLVGGFLALLTNFDSVVRRFPALALYANEQGKEQLILYLGLVIIVGFSVKTYLSLLLQKKIIFFGQSFSARLKGRMMRSLQRASYLYHLNRNSAYLLEKIQSTINGYIIQVVVGALTLASAIFLCLFMLVFLISMDPILTSSLAALLIIFAMVYDLLLKKKMHELGQFALNARNQLIKNLQQGINGFSEIKVFNKEDYFLSRVVRSAEDYASVSGTMGAIQIMPRYLMEVIMVIFVIGVTVVGLSIGYTVSQIIVTVGVFATAGIRILPAFNQIMGNFLLIRAGIPSMNSIYDELVELDGSASKKEYSGGDIFECQSKLSFNVVTLRDVSFSYPQAKHASLESIHIEIRRGQSIGLIGPSGSGKSSLLNIIMGFLKPNQGDLLVDGHSVQNNRAWLNNFSYIPQSIFLLDDTLRKNVAFGEEDEEIDENKLLKAIHMASLDEVVNRLPKGIDTYIGENGVRLSGGQRQRIALARAFYYERDIIVMDEATSSLDNETELEVINSIKRLRGDKTLIIIAHRISTVAHCDLVYQMKSGRVMASGSLDELLKL